MIHLTHLPHREKGEQVIIYVRRHWFVFLKKAIFFLVLLLLPLVIRGVVVQNDPFLIRDPRWGPALALLLSTYYLYVWVLLYQNFLDYYLDVWIVTDRRVINTEQNDLFNRVVAEHRLHRIQDVSSIQKGFLPTFLDYGDVVVQTAGQIPLFRFEEVPRPHAIARQINTLVEWNKKEHLRAALKSGRS